MNDEEFKEIVGKLGGATVLQIKDLRQQINNVLLDIEGSTDDEENSSVLREEWHLAEEIDDKGIYKKLKYRKVQRLGFYIRPIKEWFYPCHSCQERLQRLLMDGTWILGNKDYEPAIELNSEGNEVDDKSFVTLEQRQATKEELKRIGLEGWEEIKHT